VASHAIRNLIVEISKEIKRPEKFRLHQIKHRREKKSITVVTSQDHNEMFPIGEENYVNLACNDCS